MIKGVAIGIFGAGCVGSIISGIALMAADERLLESGLLMLFLGPAVFWIFSLFIYGFGELIDKNTESAQCLRILVAGMGLDAAAAAIKCVPAVSDAIERSQVAATEGADASPEADAVALEFPPELHERVRHLQKLRAQGILTEEVYQRTLQTLREGK